MDFLIEVLGQISTLHLLDTKEEIFKFTFWKMAALSDNFHQSLKSLSFFHKPSRRHFSSDQNWVYGKRPFASNLVWINMQAFSWPFVSNLVWINMQAFSWVFVSNLVWFNMQAFSWPFVSIIYCNDVN